MSTEPLNLLLVEDSEQYVERIRGLLAQASPDPFRLSWANSVTGALEKLESDPPAIVLFDLSFLEATGLDGFDAFQVHASHLPIIVLSSQANEELALRTVHAGAQDYLVKGEITPPLLIRSIHYSIERKRAENALLEAEEKYRGIFENTVEGIFQTSPEGKYISANPALARIYGFASADELIDQLTDISAELYVDANRRNEFIELMEKNDVVTAFESEVHRRDGTIIWIAENVRAVRDRSGRLMYYEGTVEDITERRRHEEEIRNSEALYHSLVETLPQNIFRKNLNEQFTFANQRFCQTLGRPLSEIVGKTDFDFYPAELAAKYQKDDQLIMETGKIFEIVEENQPPGGEKLYVNVVKTPLVDAQGRIIGLQGIFWDITEKRRAEEGLKRANIEIAQSREELRLKNEQMEEDLRMAREIQQAIIPQQSPWFPQHVPIEESVLRFCHRYMPTGAVGGDFFNIRPLSETRVGLFICDVMGHGVRSALITAIVRALVEELTSEAANPGELLAQLNHDLRSILKQSGTPLFTTAFYLVADIQMNCAWFANAGHPKPMIIRASDGSVDILQHQNVKPNPALGLFDQYNFATSTIPLNPGDKFVFFTDGVYDVERDGDLLSPDWLKAELQARARQPLGQTFDELLVMLRKYCPNQEFCDDMCLVGMEVALR
ncbi:MAG: SpoIIE family protein phosphatase [Verrucomicrobiota bacterium]